MTMKKCSHRISHITIDSLLLDCHSLKERRAVTNSISMTLDRMNVSYNLEIDDAAHDRFTYHIAYIYCEEKALSKLTSKLELMMNNVQELEFYRITTDKQ